MFGLDSQSDLKKECATFLDEYYFKDKNRHKLAIIIHQKATPKILKRLERLSISESTSFLEADEIAAKIKNQYSNEGN